MDIWLQDVRFASRRLTHSPGFAAAAILTLASPARRAIAVDPTIALRSE